MSICMQKMNSIPNFFFEILQTYCKLVTFKTLRMLDHADQYRKYHLVGNFEAKSVQLVKNFDVICMLKINFISHFYFKILQRHCKLVILRTLEVFDHPHQNHTINLLETFMLICMRKTSSTSTSFLGFCKEMANLLFWIIWACLGTHT